MRTKTSQRIRRPGAGRKSLDTEGPAEVVPVRVPPSLLRRIDQLVTKHRRKRQRWDRSREIRAAVRYWAGLLEKPEQHTGALICLILILVRRIEARTRKKWLADATTATFVRDGVERLIFHFAPTPAKRVAVPPDIASITDELITISENLYPRPGVPEMLLGDDDEWAALALISKDLGSGWERNRDQWRGKGK
jgi:Arc/MetJ-type ribon-helix-helix transcriptional regulator